MDKGFIIKCNVCGNETSFTNGDSRLKGKLFFSIHSYIQLGIECLKCDTTTKLTTEK